MEHYLIGWKGDSHILYNLCLIGRDKEFWWRDEDTWQDVVLHDMTDMTPCFWVDVDQWNAWIKYDYSKMYLMVPSSQILCHPTDGTCTEKKTKNKDEFLEHNNIRFVTTFYQGREIEYMVNLGRFNAEEAWKATKLAAGDIR